MEKLAQFPSGEKSRSVESCHISGCHGCFGPELSAPTLTLQPLLLFLEKKKGETRKNTRVFSSRNPYNPWKRKAKCPPPPKKKTREIGNKRTARKSKTNKKTRKARVREVSWFLCDCDCDFLTQVELNWFFGNQKCLRPPREPCDFLLRRKVASDCNWILFAIFKEKRRPHCGLAGDGDVCDKKSQRFVIAIFGALTLRAVRAISMSRAKNSLPMVPRQFLSLSYDLSSLKLSLKLSLQVVFNPWRYAIWGPKIVPQIVPRMPSWWG